MVSAQRYLIVVFVFLPLISNEVIPPGIHLLGIWIFPFIKIYQFYFWLCWVFVTVHGLSLAALSGGSALLWYTGFTTWWLLVWRSTGCVVRGLQ